MVWNKDARPESYAPFKDTFRPSHADYTYEAKYGIRNWMGGGRASARETIGRVAAAALARKWLAQQWGIEIVAWVESVHDLRAQVDPQLVSREAVESSLVRCPDAPVSAQMVERIRWARDQGDSVGGVIGVVARGVPAGLGEPVFDKLDASLAKALLSIGGVKAFEIGDGIKASLSRGSENNDNFIVKEEKIAKATNHSGGVLGGISDGSELIVRAFFKPTPSIFTTQKTVNRQGMETEIRIEGRHDPVIVPRAVVVVESMCAITIVDQLLINMTSKLDSIQAFYQK